MLTHRIHVLACLLALVGLVAPTTPAHADGSVSSTCLGAVGLGTGCAVGSVTVAISVDGQQSAVTLVDQGGSAIPVCTFQGQQVPCDSSDGWWSAEHGCYVKSSTVSSTDPLWLQVSGGQPSGQVYVCTLPPGVAGPAILFWAATPPVVPDQASIIRLAGRAVQSLGLRGVSVGMTPPVAATRSDSVGLVGLPNWLWVQNPGPQTWGPVSRSTSEGGITVTVSARAERVRWTLGDGSDPVVCMGLGTPYEASFGASPSPDCGRAAGYQKAGVYPVTAVSHWAIDYTSTVGLSGNLSMDLTASTTVTIAEAQVINR